MKVDKAEGTVIETPGEPGSSEITPTGETVVTSPGKKLTISGKEYDVPPELADALEERELVFSQKLSENSDELGQLRKEKADREVKPPEPQKGVQFGELIFEDSDKFSTEIKKLVDEAVSKKAASVQSTLTAEQQKTAFWDKFYVGHKEFSRESQGYLIGAILTQHYNDWERLPAEKAMEKLAEEAQKAFGIKKKPISSSVKSDGSPIVEAPSFGYETKSHIPTQTEKGHSLGSIIRDRKSKR